MTEKRRNITSGVYLVVNPSMDEAILKDKLKIILKEKIVALQIWDNFRDGENIEELIQKICELCHKENIPVLINNKWEYLISTSLDGIHFDHIPENYEAIQTQVNRVFISGLTCNNDLSLVQWAETNRLDYISFCSMFPSTTANSCELVNYDTVHKAKTIFSNPIFLAGGIKPENLNELEELDYTGIAVISGIMNSAKPDESIRKYNKHLKTKA